MTRSLGLIAALLLGGTAHAAAPPEPRPAVADETLQDGLELGEEIEARVDGDLNGDGDPDTAFVVASPDARTLYVVLSYRTEVDFGHDPAGSAKLATDPLGPAELSISKGLLVVKDLTGGTTALASTYRFRADKAKAPPRMRLIGLDATLYSRTWAHDGSEMSWNLLTGDVVASQLKLVGKGEDASYDKQFTRKSKRPVTTVYMEDTPDPEEELIRATRAK
ncbi:MAG: hypothetical protein IE934_09250 [Sphingopyxis sp.]|nr:hypothetical protein [Sphingopyxis sp.]